MKSHGHHLWLRLLATLIFGLSLTGALLWLLGGARFPAVQASPPVRPLFAPRPASTDPISNALNVPIASNVSITFDEPISLTSVTSDTFAVYGSQSPIFTGTYSLSNLSRTVTLDPARAFFPGERVDATVTTATLNITGQQAISPTVWQFWAAVEGGSGAFTAHPVSPTFDAGSLSYAVALGDVDGDGHLDALVANYSGQAQDVYLNDGTGRFAAHPISDTFGAGQSLDVALGDVDGDGDLDALVANWGQDQTVWLNRSYQVYMPVIMRAYP